MLPKTGEKFPGGNDVEKGGSGYAAIVANALAQELGQTHRAAKVLMGWTGAGERTVKHWLAGTHGPCGDHLLVLMRESDLIFEAVLTAINRRDAAIAARMLAAQRTMQEVYSLMEREQATDEPTANASEFAAARGQNDRDHDREIAGKSPRSNLRQDWFLEALRTGKNIGAAELVERWGVSDKTARRDLARLKVRGLIEFVGSPRSGRYQPVR